MNIHQLRAKAGQEIIDYLFLKSAFAELAYPRNKVNTLLHTGDLIRVKKGLYVFGSEAAREPFHPEILANLIYGPSAISLEYALAYYGMIPERVYTITSITYKRNKHFSTPVGEFSYRHLNAQRYPIGITRIELAPNYYTLIATPEKALADMLLLSPNKNLTTVNQLEQFLLEDLRLDETSLTSLNATLVAEIATVYRHHVIRLLAEYLKK